MIKKCHECSCEYEITPVDLQFYDRVSPVFNLTKCPIPPPTRCPDCRQQRRLALANERFFYPRDCGLCGKRTMSEHSLNDGKVIYCRDCWFSDRFDATSYGQDVDFSRPMFEQLKELWQAVPAQNLLIEGTCVNSEYIHYAGFAKNCYLIMHADFCEDCYYGYGFKKNLCCVDGFYNLSCELCYDCIDVNKCYGLKGCQDCNNCHSSSFLRDCIGCKDCFLCVGLREKQFCFENKQLSKKEFQAKISSINLASYKQYQHCKSLLSTLESAHAFKEFHGHNIENCSGDYIVNCKDTHASFDCEDVEGGKFLYQVVTGAKNDYDIYQYGLNLSESLECSIAGNNCYHILFSHNVHVNCSDLLYCWFVQHSKNCFGCFNMHHREYCILNKQYSKDDYQALVPKIIQHMQKHHEWGELFPISFSPFGYNKTNAQLYDPMEKQAVLAKGWKWDESEDLKQEADRVIPANELPDNIDELSDDIVKSAIICQLTGKLFKITPQELKFYREQRLPLPRICPDKRHITRFNKRNCRIFFNNTCRKCNKAIRTTYKPNHEKVFCETCYLEATY